MFWAISTSLIQLLWHVKCNSPSESFSLRPSPHCLLASWKLSILVDWISFGFLLPQIRHSIIYLHATQLQSIEHRLATNLSSTQCLENYCKHMQVLMRSFYYLILRQKWTDGLWHPPPQGAICLLYTLWKIIFRGAIFETICRKMLNV